MVLTGKPLTSVHLLERSISEQVIFDHIQSSGDRDLWPFDLKI